MTPGAGALRWPAHDAPYAGPTVTLPTFVIGRPPRTPVGGCVVLDGDEARHVRALRLSVHDDVHLVDGRGGRWRARIASVSGTGVECELLDRDPAPPPLPVVVAFGVAARDRTLWVVEKAVELGALALQPVECRRSRSVADAARSDGFWRKAGRRARAAMKQCGAARLPEIEPVRDLHEVLARGRRPTVEGAPAEDGPDVLLSRSAEASLGTVLGEVWAVRRPLRILLGPEGGLAPEEEEACREAGFRPASLGARVLRFETAAVAALAVAGDHLRTRSERIREGDHG